MPGPFLLPGYEQHAHHQERQAQRRRDDDVASSEGGHMVRSAHENGCNLNSCAGRKRRRRDFQLSGKEVFTEKPLRKPFRINHL